MGKPSYTGRNVAFRTMARIVIHALGFQSFRHLAAVSGVSHMTISDVIYRKKKIWPHAKYSSVLRIHECLHSAWEKHKHGLDKGEYILYRNWLNAWIGRCLDHHIMWQRPGRQTESNKKQRLERQSKRKAELAKALKEFE